MAIHERLEKDQTVIDVNAEKLESEKAPLAAQSDADKLGSSKKLCHPHDMDLATLEKQDKLLWHPDSGEHCLPCYFLPPFALGIPPYCELPENTDCYPHTCCPIVLGFQGCCCENSEINVHLSYKQSLQTLPLKSLEVVLDPHMTTAQKLSCTVLNHSGQQSFDVFVQGVCSELSLQPNLQCDHVLLTAVICLS